MTPKQYTRWTRTTAVYPPEREQDYLCRALPAEVGELLDISARHIRDRSIDDPQEALKEGGDVLWSLTRLMDNYGFTLQDVIDANVKKLESRKARGKIQGKGGNR